MLRIREIRRAKDISQEELARAVGISQSLVSDVEKNKTNPSLGVFVRIARYLGCSLDELVGDYTGEISSSDIVS